MTIDEVILNDIPIQPVTQKISELREMFEKLTCSHIPIQRNDEYIGCIYENDVRIFDKDKTVEDFTYALSHFFVRKTDPVLDVLKAFAVNDANIMPVLDDKNNTYLGYLELTDVMLQLEVTPFFSEEGSILVVEKNINDYSFSEISQIVESNDGRIYGVYINKIEDGIIQITLKTSQSNLNKILHTFRRYGYEIISEHREDSYIKTLEERSEYLNKYLNI